MSNQKTFSSAFEEMVHGMREAVAKADANPTRDYPAFERYIESIRRALIDYDRAKAEAAAAYSKEVDCGSR